MPGPFAWRRSVVIVTDLLTIGWLVAMVAVGNAAMNEIERLAGISDSIAGVSQSETALAGALDPLAQVPLFGGSIGPVQQQLRAAATSTSQNAAATRSSVTRLAMLARTAIVLVALFPLIAIYLPMRVSRILMLRGLRADRRRYADSAAYDAYLAHRAIATLSFTELRRVTQDPAKDIADGRYEPLALAYLRATGAGDAAPSRRRAGPTPT